MLRDATPPLSENTIPASLHGYSILSAFNPLCQAPLNLFLFVFKKCKKRCFFFFLLRVIRKWMLFFFSCWFIVLILRFFFVMFVFLRKEIKCILILKKKSWPYPICSARWLDQPSLPINSYPFIHLPHPQSHQLNGYCWYPFFCKGFCLPISISQVDTFLDSEIYSAEAQKRLKWSGQLSIYPAFVCLLMP